jgi:hypothetical protein
MTGISLLQDFVPCWYTMAAALGAASIPETEFASWTLTGCYANQPEQALFIFSVRDPILLGHFMETDAVLDHYVP